MSIKKTSTVSIIIPTYNEENTLPTLLKKVYDVKLPAGLQQEVIIVDDASQDNSLKSIQKILNANTKVIIHKHNQGKGAAIRTGLKHASGDIFIIQDADLEYDPLHYPHLLKPILDKKSHVVYGTRLRTMKLKLSGDDKTPLPLNFIANKLLSLLTNIIYNSNLTDMETCYKVFTSQVYKSIGELKANKFDIEPEITGRILKKGYMIHEVDIYTTPRKYGEGKKIKWYDAIFAVWMLVKTKVS
jgi:glycosyltransferase involved in cell wall biosynthesis